MTPTFQVGVGVAIAIDSLVWASWSVAVSRAAARFDPETLSRDSWLTCARPFERDGRCYQRLRIRRWKDRVPDFGGFRGGWSKRALGGTDRNALERFAAETRRAEYVHWAIPAIVPVFVFWNPPILVAAMVAYALVANLPFVAIQRYNRIRIERLLGRRALRARS